MIGLQMVRNMLYNEYLYVPQKEDCLCFCIRMIKLFAACQRAHVN